MFFLVSQFIIDFCVNFARNLDLEPRPDQESSPEFSSCPLVLKSILSIRNFNMSEFDFDFKWDVGKAAEKLNVSLFGAEKRKKKGGFIFTPEKPNTSSTIVHDIDDEQYTKKGKRKLKKKIGKLKKQQMKEAEKIDIPLLNTDKGKTSLNLSKGQKTKDASDSNCKENMSKKRKKDNDTIDDGNKSAKKRKLSNGETSEGKEKQSKKKTEGILDVSDTHTQGKKKVKQLLKEKQGKTEEKTREGDGESKKTRKRRSQKKKSNPSKNKYKHLALNAKVKSKEKVSDSRQSKTDFSLATDSSYLPETSLQLKRKKGKKNKLNPFNSQLVQSHADKSSISNAKMTSNEKSPQTGAKNGNKNNSYNSQSIQEKLIQSLSSEDNADERMNNERKKQSKKKQKSEEINSSSASLTNKHEKDTNWKIRKLDKRDTVKTGIKLAPKFRKDVLKRLLDESDMSKKKLNKKQKDKKAAVDEMLAKRSKNSSVPQMKDEYKSDEGSTVTESSSLSSIWGKASGLAEQAKEILNSARFRFLNEQLYTCTGYEALDIFKHDKEAFKVYHDGFKGQTVKWEMNPLDVIIKQIKDKPSSLIIADFGCGEGRLALSVPQKVHSFDLVSLNEYVIACDMVKVPLSSESVDIAVFCLSLMGTNLNDYIAEANRVLKTGGLLKVAEVVSRFKGLSSFISAVCAHGFTLLNKRDLTHMFYLMDFKKTKTVKKSSVSADMKLKPCIYKRR